MAEKDKEQMLRDALVLLNANQTTRQVTYWDLFYLAFSKSNKKDDAEGWYKKWDNGKKLPKTVEDFLLDLLTHRIEIKLEKRKAKKLTDVQRKEQP